MSELIGFAPEAPPQTEFQGRSIDKDSGLIGFTPIKAVSETTDDGSFPLSEEGRKEVNQILLDTEQLSDAWVASKPTKMRQIWNALNIGANITPFVDVSPMIEKVAGVPYTPTEKDWNAWSTQKIDAINEKMFPFGRSPTTEWMTTASAPAELLKSLRKEFNETYLNVPQGGLPPEQQSASLKKVAGVAKGTAETIGSTTQFLTSPLGIGTGGVAAMGRTAAKVVGGAFMAHMASQYPDLWKEAQEAAARGDEVGLASVGTKTALNTLFLGMGGVGLASDIGGKTSKIPSATDNQSQFHFEQRPGETTEQFQGRFREFAESLEAWRLANDPRYNTKPADAKLTEPTALLGFKPEKEPLKGTDLPAPKQPAGLIEDGPGPIITPSPLESIAARRLESIRKAEGLVRLARLQDNPVLIESAVIADDALSGKKQAEGGKLPAGSPYPSKPIQPVDESLRSDWPPQRPPARPEEGLANPNSPKPDLSADWPSIMESALRKVLDIPKPAEATPTTPTQQAPVKPWEIRQKLQERSRSDASQPTKVEPVVQSESVQPSLPGAARFVDVPDSHPVVRFWSSPDSIGYARAKAQEAFPDNPVMAHEAAQEAHAHLYLAAGSFPSNHPNVKAWSLKTISNYITDKARAFSKETKQIASGENVPETSVEPTSGSALDLKDIESSLTKVEQSFSQADIDIYNAMRSFERGSFEAVAKKHGVSPTVISRRANEIRLQIAQALAKEGVDVTDYVDVSEKIAEELGKPRGIGASVREGGRFKGGNKEAGFSSILPALSRIIHGWMKAGVSAVKAAAHAIRMFGRAVMAPVSRIINRAGYGAPAVKMGSARPSRQVAPYIPISRPGVLAATLRHPGFLRRPGKWSALDVMQEAGLTDLAQAGKSHEDRVSEWIGRWTTPLAHIERDFTRKEFQKGVDEFHEYFTLKESRDGGRTKAQADADALAYYVHMSPAGVELVDWQNWVVRETGDISRQLGVQVQEGSKWRMGNFNNEHYPRRPSQWFKDLVRDPNRSPETRAEFTQLARDMVTNGNAATLDEAKASLTRDGWQDQFEGGFLANSERARGQKLPDRVYEVSVDDFVRYIDQTADRLSQIEHFGQSLGGKEDTLFEVASKRTTDPNLRRSIKELRDHYYRDSKTPIGSELAKQLDSVTTIAYLGFSPLTAVRNLLSSQVNSMSKYGISPVAVESAKVLYQTIESAAKSMVSMTTGSGVSARSHEALIAQEIGAIQRDMRYAADYHGVKEGTLDKVTSFAMGMNSLSERVGRQIAMGASVTWLRHTRELNALNFGSILTRTRIADLRRLGFDSSEIPKLLSGDQVLTDRFLREAVKKTNFGYRAAESSTLFDRGWMRVFGKFQKYGAQMARFFDKDIIGPMFQKEGGKWSPNFGPIIKLIAGITAAGELYQEARERLFNKPSKTASKEEIAKAFTEDTAYGLRLLADRLFTSFTFGGGAGIISDYAGYLKEWGERGRFKNPAEPPAIAALEQVFSFINHRRQRGLTLEGLGGDTLDAASRFPAASQVMGAVDALSNSRLADSKFIKAEAKPMLERYGKLKGISRPSTFNQSSRVVNENTAEMDALAEAMLSGDAKEAQRIKNYFMRQSKDKARAYRIVKSAIEVNHPLYSQTSGVNTPMEMLHFRDWVRGFDEEKARQFMKAALRYEAARPR